MHSLDHIFIYTSLIWSQQVFDVVARDFSQSLIAVSKNLINKFLASLIYQGSSNPIFQDEEELSLVKEQICICKDEKRLQFTFFQQQY